MADLQRNTLIDTDAQQAITALKKGTYLLKYGRLRKPKFCPFRLSHDEKLLIWYSDKKEKQLKLSHVSRVVPGQHTAIFQRHPQPDKEYQSFSLIYSNKSLDLICKDKEEAEIWLIALRALISDDHKFSDRISDFGFSDSPYHTQKTSTANALSTSSDINYKDPGEKQTVSSPYENSSHNRFGKAISDVLTCSSVLKAFSGCEPFAKPNLISSGVSDYQQGRFSVVSSLRSSLSSAVSSPNQGSLPEDFDAFGDVYIWGEGIGNGLLGGDVHGAATATYARIDTFSPKALESTTMLDVHNISCGFNHAVLVTRRGQIFSWGEGIGGRLGHGFETDHSQPKLIAGLSGSTIGSVACGEFHTCAVTLSGDLYTWGDGSHNLGLLGHGGEVSQWTPKRVRGEMEGVHVSHISCGPWHTAAVTSAGKLFTFGEGTFGALGHGDRSSTCMPREVNTLKGLRTLRAACGVWHTAAVVDTVIDTSVSFSSGKVFTWGDGERGQLGHGDREPKLVPSCVAFLEDFKFCQVACGHVTTIALTAAGKVYTMGSVDRGQVANSENIIMLPTCIESNIKNVCIEEIACGSDHISVLSSNAEVYTWGKGAYGQLGHGDNEDRNIPTLVEALKDRRVKKVVCGSNYTAAICLHNWATGADHSLCSGCRNQFNFRRKRHNCYNCGLVFCQACSNKKSLKAALAPNTNKRYRVCDDCFTKLKGAAGSRSSLEMVNISGRVHKKNLLEKEAVNCKPRRRLSRLASFDSFRQPRSQRSKQNRNASNGSSPWESPSSYRQSRKSSASDSAMACRASSPTFWKSSPVFPVPRSCVHTDFANPELIVNDTKQPSESFPQEITILRTQVEDLTQKSQLLETKLEITSRQLKEAMLTAEEEAEKNKASKDVIWSLNEQLKEMAAKIAELSAIN